MVYGIGTFAFGEDTRDLRLTNELVDLRSGYANPARFASCGENPLLRCQRKEKRPSNDGLFSLYRRYEKDIFGGCNKDLNANGVIVFR